MQTKCIHIPDKSGQPGQQKSRMMLLNAGTWQVTQ